MRAAPELLWRLRRGLALLGAVTGALACARSPAVVIPPPAPSVRVEPGTYNGRPPRHVGLLQLNVREDGSAIFLHVVSNHLPPVELERLEVRLEPGADGSLCMSPSPVALEPCLKREVDGALTALTREANGAPRAVRLERVPPRGD